LKLLYCFTLLLLLSACANQEASSPGASALDSGPVAHENDVAAQLSVKFDSGLTRSVKTTVVEDLYQILQLNVEAEPHSYFTQIFGSTGNDGVIHYLNDRVSYIIPADSNPEGRLFVGDTSSLRVLALNVGTVLWFDALEMEPEPVSFQWGNGSIPVTSSRVGIVELGKTYANTPAMVRIGALIHEARHSDCTGGLTSQSLKQIKAGLDIDQHSCGHLHIQCPPEKGVYAGAYACDQETWGAYAVQAVYALAIENNCSSCTSEERSEARAIAVDSVSRLVPDESTGTLAQPGLDTPDMSSDSQVHAQ
jgi:hypothetical protein